MFVQMNTRTMGFYFISDALTHTILSSLRLAAGFERFSYRHHLNNQVRDKAG